MSNPIVQTLLGATSGVLLMLALIGLITINHAIKLSMESEFDREERRKQGTAK